MTLHDEFLFKTADSPADAGRLKAHFTEVYFEGVGIFTDTLFHRFPRMKPAYWFYAEKKSSQEIVAAFLLQPWFWELEGVKLKVAQMAGAATLAKFRRQGLVRELIREFDHTVAADAFDLVAINGIGGFYRQFGFCYALPVENHIHLPLERIQNQAAENDYSFRLAEESDIPFLMEQDEAYRRSFAITTFRDVAAWQYLLGDRLHTMFGSEFWIMEHREQAEKFYFRLPLNSHFGGQGLLVGEVSTDIHDLALLSLFAFCQQKALLLQKPFIRFNLPSETRASQLALELGAGQRAPFAWQIKIPNVASFLTTITPVLEKRVAASELHGFSGTFRLEFFKNNYDLMWENGQLSDIRPGQGKQPLNLRIHEQLFPILSLGHRSLSELAQIWPDISSRSEKSAQLVETLFPATRSWLYEPS